MIFAIPGARVAVHTTDLARMAALLRQLEVYRSALAYKVIDYSYGDPATY